MAIAKAKTYSDCMLYNKYPAYQASLIEIITKTDRIDKNDKMFDDVVYEIKRTRTDASIMKVLTSENSILYYANKVTPKPFKVFVGKDILKDRQYKAFIDVTNIINKTVDGYKVSDVPLLAHLINAKFAMYYTVQPSLVDKPTILSLAAKCFALLMTYIVDYVGKISSIDYARERCLYLSARFFGQNIACIDENAARSIARKVSGITEMKESTFDIALDRYDAATNPFTDIKNFSVMLGDVFRIDKLTFDTIVEKWMYLFGPGTVFALEYFPALSALLTDAYSGAYINQQKTIEKVCGKDMIEYAKNVIYQI